MSLAKVNHSKCSAQENAKLTNAMRITPKCRWSVAIELKDKESVTFVADKNQVLQIKRKGNWPKGLTVTPASGKGASIKISANEVPPQNRGRNYWYEILDGQGNTIDPVIIPR